MKEQIYLVSVEFKVYLYSLEEKQKTFPVI
jgi:hypothetical protein